MLFMGRLPREKEARRGHHQIRSGPDPRWSGPPTPSPNSASEIIISRPTYHRLRSQGRGPVEMRIGLNMIRITAEAERDWQRRMQEPRADLETRAVERAVKAGEAAARSDKHVSKKRTAGRGPHALAKRRAAAETPP